MPALPKPQKSTPESRRAERQDREPNPLKPTYPKRQKVGEQDVKVDAKQLVRQGLKPTGSTLRPYSPKRAAEMEAQGTRLTSTFQRKPDKRMLKRARLATPTGKRYAVTTWDAKRKLAKAGRRGIRYEKERKPFRKAVYALWGERCIYPGCNSMGPFEVMHAYSKGAHPEWHVESWNGFPGCVNHHRTGKQNFTSTPEWTKALQECADEMRASMRQPNQHPRPQPSWEELQDIITKKLNGG